MRTQPHGADVGLITVSNGRGGKMKPCDGEGLRGGKQRVVGCDFDGGGFFVDHFCPAGWKILHLLGIDTGPSPRGG